MISSGRVKIRMRRDLNKCMFSKVFFELQSVVDGERDFRTKFVKVNKEYKEVIFQFFSERLDLRAATENRNKDSDNHLQISGWKLYDNEADLIYFFFQRRFFNVVLRKTIIRTAGLQFSTREGFKILSKYHEHFLKNNDGVKEKVVLPDYLTEEEKVERQVFGE